jgi:hypothetical protein
MTARRTRSATGSAGRQDVFKPHGLRGIRPTGERVIAISDDISRRLVPREGLAELLTGPRRRRMFSHRHTNNATPRVGQDHINGINRNGLFSRHKCYTAEE